MSREIKFRAWDTRKKQMLNPSYDVVYEFHVDRQNKDYAFVFLNNEALVDFEVMQFTGLRLTNGQEVFEGDIIKDEDGKIGLIDFDDYDHNACHYRILYYPIAKYTIISKEICLINPDESEVIGNIYENPELLEGE